MKKRLLSLGLALVMLLSLLPTSVLATDYAYGEKPAEGTKYAVGDTIVVYRWISYDLPNDSDEIPENTQWVKIGESNCNNPVHWGERDLTIHDEACNWGVWQDLGNTYGRFQLVSTATPEQPDPDQPGPGDDATPGKVTASKTAVDNGNGTYTITLSVQGNKTTATTAKDSDVVLVVDNSGSMENTVSYNPRKDRLDVAKEAAKEFSKQLLASGKNNRLALIGFSWDYGYGAINVKCDLTNSKSTFDAKVGEMNHEGGTNYSAALKEAKSILDNRTDKSRAGVVVFITDGVPGKSDDQSSNTSVNGETEAKALKDANYTVYTIGISLGSNGTNLLKNKIATSAAHAYTIDSSSNMQTQLNGILSDIAYQIKEVAAGTKAEIEDAVNLTDYEFVLGTDGEPKIECSAGTTADVDKATGKVTWTIGDIPADEAATCKITVKANNTTALREQAEDKYTNTSVKLSYYVGEDKVERTNLGDPHFELPANAAKYTVNHFKANADGTYPTTPSETEVKGPVLYGTEITPASVKKSYTGYAFDHADKASITISSTGSNVINLYYGADEVDENNPYAPGSDGTPDIHQAVVTFTVNGGTWSGDTHNPIKMVYTFEEKDASGTWVAKATSLEVPTPVANGGYSSGSWVGTAPVAGSSVTANADYVYSFGKTTYNITVSVTGGTASPSGSPIQVEHGDSKTISFTPNTGHVLATVKVDGSYVDKTGFTSKTFSNVTANHSIEVVYMLDANGNGTPDDYEATITYKVVNGTWATGGSGSADVVQDFVTKVYNTTTYQWDNTNPKLGDKTIPTAQPDASHTSAATWTPVTPTDSTEVTESKTYTCTFGTLKTYKVTYDLDGGEGDATPQTKTHNVDLTLHAAPTRAGYTFNGWKATDNTKYTAGGSYTKNEGTTLTAQWTDAYTLIYNAGQGTGSAVTETHHAASVTLKGIGTDAGKIDFTAPADSVFLGWSATDPGKVLDKGDLADLPELISAVSFSSTVTSHTVYAVWGYDRIGENPQNPTTPNVPDGKADVFQAVVTYKVVNGYWGTIDDVNDKADKTEVVDLAKQTDGTWSGTLANVPTPYSDRGYTNAVTWTQDGNNCAAPTTGTVVTKDTTFQAEYRTLSKVSVSYKPGDAGTDAQNMPGSASLDYGSDYTLSKTMPTWEGHRFTGWLGGKGETYQPGASYGKIYFPTAFQAQWADAPSSIEIDPKDPNNDGSTEDAWVKKNLTVSGSFSGETFEVTVTPVVEGGDSAGNISTGIGGSFEVVDNSYTGKVTMTAAGTEAFSFDKKITFTKEGTYTFNVVEKKGTTSGMTYDKETYQLVVTIVKGQNGLELGEVKTVTVKNSFYRASAPSGGGVRLEKGTHFNYVMGYSDGTIRPNNEITRGEVAIIFFRLLTDESRKEFYSEHNDFTDVLETSKSNIAISTLTNAGILTGYSDGTFRPNAKVTRGQLAAIIARFADMKGDVDKTFSDIDGYWAKDLILLAASNGWIDGYSDGTFRPANNITRAQTMAIINRALDRQVSHVEDLLDEDVMNVWVDNMDPDAWYYFHVQEATNNHAYTRKSAASLDEKWTAKLKDIDWSVYQF